MCVWVRERVMLRDDLHTIGREELRRFHRSAAKSDHDFFSEKCEEKKITPENIDYR